MVSADTLIRWHVLAALLHTIVFLVSFGVAAVHWDKINRNGIPVIVWMPIFAGLTAIFELGASFPFEMETRLSRRVSVLRWVEYSITASIMLVAIAQLSNITDETTLFLGIVLPNILCQFTGYMLEKTLRWKWFLVGSVFGILPWVFISIRFFEQWDEIPGFVVGIYFSLILLFCTFPLVAARYAAGYITFSRAELEYIFWSFVAKTALVVQVLGGSARTDS